MSSEDEKEFVYHTTTTEIINRIKKAEGLRFDADIAIPLRADKKNVSVWKARDAIPFDKLIEYSRMEGVSLDWLVNGRGPMRVKDMIEEPGAIYKVTTNQDAVYWIAGQVFKAASEGGKALTEEKFCDVVKLAHRDMLDRQESSVPYVRIKGLVDLCG